MIEAQKPKIIELISKNINTCLCCRGYDLDDIDNVKFHKIINHYIYAHGYKITDMRLSVEHNNLNSTLSYISVKLECEEQTSV